MVSLIPGISFGRDITYNSIGFPVLVASQSEASWQLWPSCDDMPFFHLFSLASHEERAADCRRGTACFSFCSLEFTASGLLGQSEEAHDPYPPGHGNTYTHKHEDIGVNLSDEIALIEVYREQHPG